MYEHIFTFPFYLCLMFKHMNKKENLKMCLYIKC